MSVKLLFIILTCISIFGDNTANNGDEFPYIIWMSPIFSGGGYCSESMAYIEYLYNNYPNKILIEQHGDSYNFKYVRGLSKQKQEMLFQLTQTHIPNPMENKDKIYIIICHSEPGAWYPPYYSTSYCPPIINNNSLIYLDNVYYIGRTMFETDRLPGNWDIKLNIMHEIWVPTSFHYDIFSRYGNLTDDTKLSILWESVNTTFFNPNRINISYEKRLKKLNLKLDDDSFVFLRYKYSFILFLNILLIHFSIVYSNGKNGKDGNIY